MVEFDIAAFGAIAAALFVTELTDKDAFLLIAVSTKMRAWVVFLAGATSFTITTALFVSLGSVLVALVPVQAVRIAGGVIMIGYALWEAKGLVGLGSVEAEESKIERTGGLAKAFLSLVAALAFLDIAGDATEVLTIVFVAHYHDPVLVFSGSILGLVSAAAMETALGNRLGRLLTPKRLRVVSIAVFLVLGVSILVLSLV